MFTSSIHTPEKMDVLERRFEIMKQRIIRLKAEGFHVGVNHLCTLGHADENRAAAEQLRGRPFTSLEGAFTQGQFCPRDPVWRREYIIPTYRMIAETGPEFIWIDDDVRLTHHGKADFGCFCDDCFKTLCEFLGADLTREDFVAYFDNGTPEEISERRKKFLLWNRNVMAELLTVIEKTVHGVNPKILLCEMDGLNYYNSDYPRQAGIISGPEHNPVWWRPGDCVYNDFMPRKLLHQAFTYQSELSLFPDIVTVIQGEIESFPHMNLWKADKFTGLESAVYCAVGCTGVALNIISWDKSASLSSYEHLFEYLKQQRVFNDRIVELHKRKGTSGIWTAIDKDQGLVRLDEHAHWMFTQSQRWGLGDINAIGLPLTVYESEASCAMLCELNAKALSDEQLKKWLSKGVCLDAGALRVLNERGFGAYTGFAPDKVFDRDSIEESVEHPLNPIPFTRNPRQSFWKNPATSLKRTDAGAQIVSRLIDYENRELAECVSGCFENSLGGRVFAAGYSAWNYLSYDSKYRQMHAVFRYLSRERLDADFPECRLPVALWTRRFADRVTVCAVNISMDACDDLIVRLRTPSDTAVLIRRNFADQTVTAFRREKEHAYFKIRMDSFELIMLDSRF